MVKIKLNARKVIEGDDFPYRDDIVIDVCNDIEDSSNMILSIKDTEYIIDKKEMKKIIEILNMED